MKASRKKSGSKAAKPAVRVAKVTSLQWLDLGSCGRIATLALNRPEAANSFSAELISEMTWHLLALAKEKNVRALVLTGAGKHFSAGADLAWMQAAAKLSQGANVKDAQALAAMFAALGDMPCATIAVVRGAAYGGAVGLAAACDYAIAADDARFCLSETKLGLIPAVIYPYLAQKMRPGQLRRLSLSARVFSGVEALGFGLIERSVSPSALTETVRDELAQLLQTAPLSHDALKHLHKTLRAKNFAPSAVSATTIAKVRVGAEAKAGLAAFFAKQNAPWVPADVAAAVSAWEMPA